MDPRPRKACQEKAAIRRCCASAAPAPSRDLRGTDDSAAEYAAELGPAAALPPVCAFAQRLPSPIRPCLFTRAHPSPCALPVLGVAGVGVAFTAGERAAAFAASSGPALGVALGDGSEGAALGDAREGAALGDAIEGAALGDAREDAALGDTREDAALGDVAVAAAVGDFALLACAAAAAVAAAVGDVALDAAFGDVATAFAGDVLLTAGNRIGSVSAIKSFFYRRSRAHTAPPRPAPHVNT